MLTACALDMPLKCMCDGKFGSFSHMLNWGGSTVARSSSHFYLFIKLRSQYEFLRTGASCTGSFGGIAMRLGWVVSYNIDSLAVPRPYPRVWLRYICDCIFHVSESLDAIEGPNMPRDLTACGRYPPQPLHKPIAFYSCARLGDPDQLAKIVATDPYFITQDNGAGAPLHFATTYKQLDMVSNGSERTIWRFPVPNDASSPVLCRFTTFSTMGRRSINATRRASHLSTGRHISPTMMVIWRFTSTCW